MKLSDESDIRKSKLKLAIQYTSITLVIVIILIGAFYLIFSNFAYKDFDSTLMSRAMSISIAISREEESAIQNLKSISEILTNYNLENESIMIFDSKGNIIYKNVQDKFALPKNIGVGFYTLEGLEDEENKTVRVYITKLNDTNYFLLVGMNYDNLLSSLHNVLVSFLLIIPFIIALTIFISYRFANNAIKPIEESIKMLKQFTSDASHELKTPISTIKANVEVALMKDRDPEYYKEKLKTILDSINRMSKLIQDMLFLSRLDMRNYPVKLEPVNINDVFLSLNTQFEDLAISKNVNLVISTEDNIQLMTDKNILFEILSIFIENGIEYNKENGFVKVYARKVGESVEITVEDSGIGIKEQDIPHIFDRFYRGEKSRSRETGGVGLGLSIAKELAKLIDATIRVESRVGSGSKFILILRREKYGI
jgi:signal transduction histidine kinase